MPKENINPQAYMEELKAGRFKPVELIDKNGDKKADITLERVEKANNLKTAKESEKALASLASQINGSPKKADELDLQAEESRKAFLEFKNKVIAIREDFEKSAQTGQEADIANNRIDILLAGTKDTAENHKNLIESTKQYIDSLMQIKKIK